ncbi:envelope integrity protein Cei [Saccharomonospora saliphila]|uniref:envelope integrity protein Cei n=1 Tax=Saccharomonospora saliphila TaxID=369829 RepID=UPI0003744F0F|nr:envelope integrity protein Cei [Saccharomonospora saliphila]
MASGTAGPRGSGGAPGTTDRTRSRPYRRRKPLPAVALIALLSVAAVVVWVNAVGSTEDLTEAISCEPAPRPPEDTTYTRVPYDALDETSPVPPGRVAVRVLNANGTRGQASITTEALRQLGFERVAEPANDPAFPAGEADCHGQIRFGANGERAARTVQLIDPCLELVRDGRKDASVDLAIGTDFNGVSPSDDAVAILDRLKTWAERTAGEGGGEQAAGDDGPVIDQDLLDAIPPTHC